MVFLYARISAGLWFRTGNFSTTSLSISAKDTMLLPLKSSRFQRSWSCLWSLIMALIFTSRSSKSCMHFFLTKLSAVRSLVAAWVWPCLRSVCPHVSPEMMSASKSAWASGLTRWRMYAQNSTKRTCPPWFLSIFWNSATASDSDRLRPNLLMPPWNSRRSTRRSLPESMRAKTCHSLLNQKMLSNRAWNSCFSTQSSPSPSFKIVFL
mmetsp:Transcript_108001/g.348601  ORF Transcript_108001/g.348601 Transcript_108001/m.348601 type:complete len:208 (-) Transcript_108001:415-1038(-)